MNLTPQEETRLTTELEHLEALMDQRAQATGSYESISAAIIFLARCIVEAQKERLN